MGLMRFIAAVTSRCHAPVLQQENAKHAHSSDLLAVAEYIPVYRVLSGIPSGPR